MNSAAEARWRLGVDIGGTFTDVVLCDIASGTRLIEKVLTTQSDPALGVLMAIDNVVARASINASDLASVVHGTTLVANAIIERKGVRTALITTAGFRDVLAIGREWRYDLFHLDIELPEPLVPRERCLELRERIDADGNVVEPILDANWKRLEDELDAIAPDAIAVCLLHSYLNPSHEQHLAGRLKNRFASIPISLSSAVSPEMGEYERTSTTVANAYVHPIFRRYVEHLNEALSSRGFRHDLLLVLSDGRLTRADVATQFPIRLVQSGPAAGAEAARLFGESAGEKDVLCFDMGGTTAKACFIADGAPERTITFEVARETRFAEGSGLPLQSPAVDMIEIGAGGGSIAQVDSRGLIEVGPESASADPGPACYGRGGDRPTVTDCDLVLGYLDAESFLGGQMTLDPDAARRVIETVLAGPLGITVEEAAWGVHETVTSNMAQAATMHAIEKALDPTAFAVLPIGGAGPVHACSLAKKMGVERLLCPRAAGVASAVGMLGAPISFEVARAAPTRLADIRFDGVGRLIDAMHTEAYDLVTSAGVARDVISIRLSAMMRYVGQGYEIEVAMASNDLAAEDATDRLHRAFSDAYQRRYGRMEAVEAEVLSWRLIASGPRPAPTGVLGGVPESVGEARVDSSQPRSDRSVWFDSGFVMTPVYPRDSFSPGLELVGPAVIEEAESTLILPPSARLQVDESDNVLIHL